MTYPTATPSARIYTPGNWAVKTYNAMSGAETRIRYGNKRFKAQLKLEYKNISDLVASSFLQHYDDQKGTYKKFTVPSQVLNGWEGTNYIPNTDAPEFRYSGPPSVVSVRPGVSTVSVELTSVI